MKTIIFLVTLLALFNALRGSKPEDWNKIGRAPKSGAFTFQVALKHKSSEAVKEFQDKVLDIANPNSPNYGEWMTSEEILEMIAPPQEHHDIVYNFFASFPDTEVISFKDNLKIKTTIKSVEQMFSCSMYSFIHKASGAKTFRQEGGATIHESINDYIDLVSGLTAFPIMKKAKKARVLTSQEKKHLQDLGAGFGYISPSSLKQLYNIPSDLVVTNSKTTQTVMEFLPVGAPLATDLTKFAQDSGTTFTNYTKVVGPYNPGQEDTEATLDVEYMQSTAQKAVNWYWTIGDGWALEMATEIFNQQDPPLVVSVSYGWPEIFSCQSAVTKAKCGSDDVKTYVTRANTELSKVAGIGVSVLVATQDEGAPSEANEACQNKTHPVFSIYPSSSPWVTAVSASTVVGGTTVSKVQAEPICSGSYSCAVCTGGACSETPCSVNNTNFRWTTGGGFAAYATRQSWQDKAATAYLNSGAEIPPSQYFESGNRAYPDITAAGDRILIVQNGRITESAGTSASTPIVAGIISLLNDARLNNGKKGLGFLNPMLYDMGEKMPEAYNDITTGDNKCSIGTCCEYGYGATKGYDVPSGWGSFNFANALKYVNSLP